MTKARDPYSRVYWKAIDDPKFAKVWDDDHALSAWLRLLVAADMAWPASATIYHGIRRTALKVLCDVKLVDMQAGGRYRIHGLDKERAARSRQASDAAAARWDDDEPPHPASNADGMRPHPGPKPGRMPSQDEPSKSRAEQSQDEPSMSRGHADDVLDAMASVEELTGRPFGWGQGSPIFDTLAADVRDLGLAKVIAEYRAVKARSGSSPIDPAGIVFGAHKRLFPIPDGPTGRAAKPGKGFNPTSEEAWDAFGGKP